MVCLGIVRCYVLIYVLWPLLWTLAINRHSLSHRWRKGEKTSTYSSCSGWDQKYTALVYSTWHNTLQPSSDVDEIMKIWGTPWLTTICSNSLQWNDFNIIFCRAPLGPSSKQRFKLAWPISLPVLPWQFGLSWLLCSGWHQPQWLLSLFSNFNLL